MINVNVKPVFQTQIAGIRIPRDTYFLGSINGLTGLFCKLHNDLIIPISQEMLTLLSHEVNVLEYNPVHKMTVGVKALTKPTQITVANIPEGTAFLGQHGYHTGTWLKCTDNRLILLDNEERRKIILLDNAKSIVEIATWGDYCKGNIVSDYQVVDLTITCEV